MDKIFEALSSITRRKILAYLSEGPMHAGDVAAKFDLSQPTVSKHLRILEEAGLLVSTRHKNFIRYEVKKDVLVGRLFDFMTNFCSVSQELKREAIEKVKAEEAEEKKA